MNKIHVFFLSCFCVIGQAVFGQVSQTDYSNQQQLASRIDDLQRAYPQYVQARSLTKTAGGSDVWVLTIGAGTTAQKPAVAVVGGVDGKYLIGVELAIGFAEQLLRETSQDSLSALLEAQTFYVFPNVSPDATQQYFASLQYERSGNASPIDYDRDGKVGEDGYDDLDRDGKVTWIRVEDPTGTYMVNPNEPRSMVLADVAKGQRGTHAVYTEGIDNDKDGVLNEDGEEGVHFNKNATYNYKHFVPGGGEHAVSELENRALFDFLYDAFNVYAVVSFGPYNNLVFPEQAARGGEVTSPTPGRRPGGRKITSWSANDAKASAHASTIYKQMVSTQDAPRGGATPGNFAEWAYYHYGRLSFSTPGWWVPSAAGDSTSRGRPSAREAIDDPVAAYFKWADTQGIEGNYANWTAIDHPDFPGKRVEVGGVHPFVLHNPPYDFVADLTRQHTQFIVRLADLAPHIQISDVITEKLDSGLTRVTLKVFNSGSFPTLTEVGERSYFLKRVAVNVKTNGNQKIVSGRPMQTLGAIGGHEVTELTWIVQGTGTVDIEVGSPSSGFAKQKVSL